MNRADGSVARGTITLDRILHHFSASRPDAIVLQDAARRVSFSQFHRDVEGSAAGLLAQGVRVGDRVGYVGRNSVAYFELLFAVGRIGAVLVPISWRLTAVEVARIVEDAALSRIFVEAGCVDTVFDDGLRVWVIAEHGDALARLRCPDAPSATDAADDSAVVVQLYTSGTTGAPKGVMLTHRNLVHQRHLNAMAGVAWEHWSSDDVSLITMPVAHVSGTGWGLYGLFHGARGIVIRDFVASEVADLIACEGVTRLFLVPTALHQLLDAYRELPAPDGLKHILYGGAPITQDLLDACRAIFSAGLVQLYGMTETSGAVSALTPEAHLSGDAELLRSAGTALPHVQLAVADPVTGQITACGEGEILVKCSGIMAGYWGKPGETAAIIDADGWLHTGDLGIVTQTGVLTIRDRLQDMIISGGENVYPGEVEAVLRCHPAVADVVVAGVPDRYWGEAVTAFIVLNAGQSLDVNTIRNWSSNFLAHYKNPRKIILMSALPRNPNGKVLRRELVRNA